ncbi:redoxin domain-containing protein [Pseudoalteromonas ostreae]|uniref:redoxin domain-containing protein n=1 Tax=Pseudoalteromonas ostreae TaxID=2774154 RepID=UPI001B35EE97|nr:redoxin domain-containing protein [Pseudoalteromonas ostreae]
MYINTIWQVIITALAFFTLLSLILNIIIIKKLMDAKNQLSAPTFNLSTFPAISAISLLDHSSIETKIHTPSALIFLATNCPKCKSKIEKIEKMTSSAHKQGVAVKIIIHNQMSDIERFFNRSSLIKDIWQLSFDDYRTINPLEISPAYLFVNEKSEIEGQGMVDDESWHYFEQQILGNES